eukprot:comp21320_c0_seq1/m.45795 comp21320_c0_seq1/g.45795  ORF comp21320_c0_seq1/g.45795 comp21320_c0_seq1/m.45795 type:complete len:396 (+) comp21320_c0_seq1:871-2058(+)
MRRDLLHVVLCECRCSAECAVDLNASADASDPALRQDADVARQDRVRKLISALLVRGVVLALEHHGGAGLVCDCGPLLAVDRVLDREDGDVSGGVLAQLGIEIAALETDSGHIRAVLDPEVDLQPLLLVVGGCAPGAGAAVAVEACAPGGKAGVFKLAEGACCDCKVRDVVVLHAECGAEGDAALIDWVELGVEGEIDLDAHAWVHVPGERVDAHKAAEDLAKGVVARGVAVVVCIKDAVALGLVADDGPLVSVARCCDAVAGDPLVDAEAALGGDSGNGADDAEIDLEVLADRSDVCAPSGLVLGEIEASILGCAVLVRESGRGADGIGRDAARGHADGGAHVLWTDVLLGFLGADGGIDLDAHAWGVSDPCDGLEADVASGEWLARCHGADGV